MERGLHPSCDESEIIQELKDKGFQIIETKNIIKKEKSKKSKGEEFVQKTGMQLFMLTFHYQEKSEKIYAIKSIIKISMLDKN